jgi:predicted nucleic acid-binding protein
LIVIDASALTEVLLGRLEATSGLESEYADRNGDPLHAPDVVELETINALRRLTKAGAVSERRAVEALNDLGNTPMVRYPHAPFRQRIWELRDALSAYDAAYLALAEVLDATLFTCDAGLAARGRRSLGSARVRHVR